MERTEVRGVSFKDVLNVFAKNLSHKDVLDIYSQLSISDLEFVFTSIKDSLTVERPSNKIDYKDVLTIHFDGASRGNPGRAGVGAVGKVNNEIIFETKKFIGETTNNVAEYNGLLLALRKAKYYKAKKIHLISDSELLVKQVNGEYKVKNPDLKKLYLSAFELLDSFISWDIKHVLRHFNKHADALANEAVL